MINGVVFLSCVAIWLLKITSLPKLYFRINIRRGIAISQLRQLERVSLKVVKLKLDLRYFQTCIDLSICPEFLKFKPPRISAYSRPADLYQIGLKRKLLKVRKATKNMEKQYPFEKKRIFTQQIFLKNPA